ncbi:conserved protein of unknown function [Magnetospirillum sp. XM-1]|nr:conserved protein of unknown function [Magnetospirillum sp. XM-1]
MRMPGMRLPNGFRDHYQRLIAVKCCGNVSPAMIRFIRLETAVGGKFALHAKASRTRRN